MNQSIFCPACGPSWPSTPSASTCSGGAHAALAALAPHLVSRGHGPGPRVVCLCGSTRFRAEFTEANRRMTMAGKIVVAPGVFAHDGDPLTDEEKTGLDALHFRKIDLADEVFVVNPGGYVGDSTRREIAYARQVGKPIAFLTGAPMREQQRDDLVTALAEVVLVTWTDEAEYDAETIARAVLARTDLILPAADVVSKRAVLDLAAEYSRFCDDMRNPVWSRAADDLWRLAGEGS